MFLSTLQEKRYLTSFGPCDARTLTKCYLPISLAYSVIHCHPLMSGSLQVTVKVTVIIT